MFIPLAGGRSSIDRSNLKKASDGRVEYGGAYQDSIIMYQNIGYTHYLWFWGISGPRWSFSLSSSMRLTSFTSRRA